VCGPGVAPPGIVMLLVTWVELACTLFAPVIVPTVTLLTGAICGGGLTLGSRLIVRVNVVPRLPVVGVTLRIPLLPPPPDAVPQTGSYGASDVRATRKNFTFSGLPLV